MATDFVSVGRELRPSRVGLMVDPHDRAMIKRAIAHASASWGGQYWPMVRAPAAVVATANRSRAHGQANRR